jgi:uncharacterized protein with NRDE domain
MYNERSFFKRLGRKPPSRLQTTGFHFLEGCSRMCLVFISIQTDGKGPVMIGANREESRLRPTTSPVCCRRRGLRCLLAGADHGPDGTFPEMGTWLGVNEAGMAIAVTNRHDGELAWADQTRSRGLLAVELIGNVQPERAIEAAKHELARGGYGGCNFLIANRDRAFVIQAPGPARISVCRLQSGIHAMTNLDLDDQADARIQLVRTTLDALNFTESARRLCRDERIVVSGAKHETISSSVILASHDVVLFHKDGDSRTVDYQEFRLLDPD